MTVHDQRAALDALDPQTRQAVQSLLAQVQQRDHEIAFKQALIDKLTHEMAILKRMPDSATAIAWMSEACRGPC